MKLRSLNLFFLLVFLGTGVFAEEKINSVYQSYYRYLELTGGAENPALMYHSYSNNQWMVNPGHPWEQGLAGQNSLLETGKIRFSLFSPEIMVSFNTAYDRQELSDGAWWQGRGLNAFVSAGVRLETPFLNATFAPEFWSAQNLDYDILPSVYTSEYGYFMGGIDYPQRMGNEPIYEWGWGQSDIRLNWKTLTLGFSAENILWGPSLVNSLMISDNASGFPHVDFGLRKTSTAAGEVELLAFRGQVSESDFYDTDDTNNKTFFSGLTGGFAPAVIPGLSLGFKWTLMTSWENFKDSWQLQIFGYDFTNDYFGNDQMDMKGSLTLNWKFPESGFEWYFEFFREDYSPSLRFILLAPGHSAGYTLGGQKAFLLSKNRGIRVTVEWNELIQSRDYAIDAGAGGIYYSHGQVPHGYTHMGQMLGAGIGPGSDAETVKLDYYASWGSAGIMLQRISWNKMILYGNPSTMGDPEGPGNLRLNTELNLGLNGILLVRKDFHFTANLITGYNLNHNYVRENDVFNLYMNLGMIYRY